MAEVKDAAFITIGVLAGLSFYGFAVCIIMGATGFISAIIDFMRSK